MSGIEERQLTLLLELSNKMGVFEELCGDVKCINREVNALKMQFSSIIVLSPEEVSFIRAAMQAKIAERDFWMQQSRRIVGVGLIAAIGVVGTALWHYITNLINSRGGS
jgi:hypothetical protein